MKLSQKVIDNLNNITQYINNFTQSYYTDSASFDDRISGSYYAIEELSASVSSLTGDFSSSVYNSFSASFASQNELSASIANDLNNLMPQFGKVMNVLQQLDGNSEADMDKIKEEMDALLQNDFGIDMKKKLD